MTSCPEQQLNRAHLKVRRGAACSSVRFAGIGPPLLCRTRAEVGNSHQRCRRQQNPPLLSPGPEHYLFGKRNANHQLGEDPLPLGSCSFGEGFEAEPAPRCWDLRSPSEVRWGGSGKEFAQLLPVL